MSAKEEEWCDDDVNINNDNNDDCNDDCGGDAAVVVSIDQEWNKLQRQLLRLSSSMEAVASKESSRKQKNDNCNVKKSKPSIDIDKPDVVATAAAVTASPSEAQRNGNRSPLKILYIAQGHVSNCDRVSIRRLQ